MRKILIGSLLALTTLVGCSNRDAALFGSLIGRSLGRPVGTVATAIDETVQTASDVIKENPRYQQTALPKVPDQSQEIGNRKTHYYRTEMLLKTRGPAQIEAVSLQQSKDVSNFWH